MALSTRPREGVRLNRYATRKMRWTTNTNPEREMMGEFRNLSGWPKAKVMTTRRSKAVTPDNPK